MQHNSIGLLKISHRVLPCLVALLLVLSLVTMPMKVEASGAAAIAIGAAGSMTPVGYGIAAVALLIALCGAAITSSADLARESESVYSSLDPSVQAWMDSTGQKLASNSETVSFVIPQTVISNFNNNYKKNDDNDKNKLSPNLPYVAVGSDQLMRLDQLNPLNVMSSDVTGLLAQGVGTLQAMSLVMQNLNYRTTFQYQTMHDAFYGQLVETRLALNNTIQTSTSGIYNRLGSVATRMETQFVDTRQALMNKMDTIATPMNNNITKVRNQIVEQLISTTSQLVNPLSGIKTTIEDIAAGVGSLAGSKDDTDDQIAVVPPFSVPNLKSKLTSIADGFKRLFQRPDEDDDNPSIPWLPFNLFSKDDGSNGFFMSMFDDSEFINTLKGFYQQSLDIITLEENQRIADAGYKSSGSKIVRDALCSDKIEFVDLWLTPHEVIDQFFKITKLNKDECFDPCASDGRWLGDKGKSIDILPMTNKVERQDFLKFNKRDLPAETKYIVGNLPFCLLDEFVNKALSLTDDCYFLVSGDTILKHFPNNIKHIYIFSGLEGNQKDNRSRCEFDVPFLLKSALWCCIVHITKENQPKWTVESNISNDEKRDGYHVALGKNTFIKSDVKIDENPRITKIPVTSSISWKDGKKIKIDGETIDLRNFSYLNENKDNQK